MRITYIARSFLDYRVPVLAELDRISGGQLHFVFSDKWTPPRAVGRLRTVLGDRSVSLFGEKSIGVDVPTEANTSVCIPYQPGLLKVIAWTQPEVLVGDGFFQWTYAALLRRILRGTPLVICYERWAHVERNAQWYRKLYRKLAMPFVDAISCNGRLAMEYTCSLGFPSERVTTGHMAADTESLELGAGSGERESLRRSWSAQGIVFLCVARLIRIKGVAELLRAWKMWKERVAGSGEGERATLVVVGAGPEEEGLRRKVSEDGLRKVCFVGAVDYNGIERYYTAADAFIMPGLEDNWSLVVPEAMACGLPILCSKYNGCWPELVLEGRNGWVFDPYDSQDIVRCLDACLRASETPTLSLSALEERPPSSGAPLLASRSLLQEMGEKSREILKDHTPRKAAEAIYRACELAIAHRQTDALSH